MSRFHSLFTISSHRLSCVSAVIIIAGICGCTILSCAAAPELAPRGRSPLWFEPPDSPRAMCQLGLRQWALDVFRSADIRRMRDFAENMGSKWPEHDIEIYADVVTYFAGLLASTPPSKEKETLTVQKEALAREIVDRALEQERNIPLDILVELSQISVSGPRHDLYQTMGRWIRIKSRIESEIDLKWVDSPLVAPTMTDIPPGWNDDWGWPPVVPIADPHQRTVYDRGMTILRKRVVKYRWQRMLRRLKDDLLAYAELWIDAFTSTKTFDFDRTKKYVTQLFDNPKARRRIIEQLQSNSER